MKFLIINGPNINMLGIREPGIYGSRNYNELLDYIRDVCSGMGIESELFQSNHEGAIVDKIQSAYGNTDGIVINPAAYTHTSIAILDALKAVKLPTVEVHLTNINSRDDFRRISYTSRACIKTITGLGFDGYRDAILCLSEYIKNKKVL